MDYVTHVENVAMYTTIAQMEDLWILVTSVASMDTSLPNVHQTNKVTATHLLLLKLCMSHCIGNSIIRHSSPFPVHSPAPPHSNLQSHVLQTASKHPVYHPGVPEHGHNKKKTATTKQDTLSNTRPVAVTSSLPHGRQLYSNVVSQRSQFSGQPASDVTMNSAEPEAPRRKGNHEGSSNKGRASKNISDVYHHRVKQGHQQDSRSCTK